MEIFEIVWQSNGQFYCIWGFPFSHITLSIEHAYMEKYTFKIIWKFGFTSQLDEIPNATNRRMKRLLSISTAKKDHIRENNQTIKAQMIG